MIPWQWRHWLLQTMFWNPVGTLFIRMFIWFERRFTAVVRNFSLRAEANGEAWVVGYLEDLRNPTVFDVGFHRGRFTAWVLDKNPDAEIYAFDPSDFAREKYQTGPATWERNIHFQNSALSTRTGSSQFYDYGDARSSLKERVELESKMENMSKDIYDVELDTLDNFCARKNIDRIDLLKIDVEGHEMDVLGGSERMFNEGNIKLVLFEFGSGWISSGYYLYDAVSFLEASGYDLYRLFNGFLAPFEYDSYYDSPGAFPAMYVGLYPGAFPVLEERTRNIPF